MTGTSGLEATQVLHCNLNVVDVAAAAALYERGLALVTRMRSESVDGDSTPLGIEGSTHSVAWFLYDHRGGHVSPAVELVEWHRPPTAGRAYGDPTTPGMQALVFAVPSVTAAVTALRAAGASSAVHGVPGDDDPPADAELLDRDGVRIALAGDDSVAAPTFAGVRITCNDLDESAAWYGELGWRPVGERIVAHRQGARATTRHLALPTHPFRLELTEWDAADRSRRAHANGNARGLFRMALAVDDVRAAHEAARVSGRVDVGEPQYVPLPGTPLGGLWVSFFRDPNGVMVELVERVTRRRRR